MNDQIDNITGKSVDGIQSLRAAIEGRPFLSINGAYTIAPGTTSEEMLNDVGCLLEAAIATIDSINDGLQDEGGQMAAEASRNVPRMLYGVLYQLEMARNLAAAAFVPANQRDVVGDQPGDIQ